MTNELPTSNHAKIKLRLNSGLRFIPQTFGNKWHCVVEDVCSKRYFRIGRLEYLIASCLNGHRDPGSIFEIISKSQPQLNVTKQDVDQTLRWLISMGLVTNVDAPETAKPMDSIPSLTIPDPFMLRIPILRGEFLEGWLRPWTVLTSPPAVVIQLLILLVAIIVFIGNSAELLALSATLFVPSAILWWIIAWLIMKGVHELGHAVICLAHGRELRGAGLGIFYLAPIPYVDTTDMWRIPNRRHRAYCAMGGMWFELVVAAIAILVCEATELSGLRYFCISLATLGSIATLAFNANPFTRFDGYYVLSDLLDRPNLWTEGQQALRTVLQGGWRGMCALRESRRGLLLATYGFVCAIYRILMLITLAWGTWLTYRGIGVGLIGLAGYLWFVAPWLKSRRAVSAKPHEHRLKPPLSPDRQCFLWLRRLAIASVVGGCGYFCSDYPSPLQPAAPGYVSYREPIVLRASSNGIVVEVFQSHDAMVTEGSPILRIENPELELQVHQLRRSVGIAEEKCRVMRGQSVLAELQAEQAKLMAAREQLALTESKWNDLLVKAPRSGRLIARQIDRLKGQSIKDGQAIATIAASTEIEVKCSLAQEDVESYRSQVGSAMKLYFPGARTLDGTLLEVMPRGSDTLENPALAARFGGPIGVQLISSNQENDATIRTLRPRFEARIAIDPIDAERLPLGGLCHIRPQADVITIASLSRRIGRTFLDWILPSHGEPTL